MSELRYDGQVVVVTGAGGGLGRSKSSSSRKLFGTGNLTPRHRLCSLLWFKRSKRCCERSGRILQGRGHFHQGMIRPPKQTPHLLTIIFRPQMLSLRKSRPRAVRQSPTTTASSTVIRLSRPPSKTMAASISSSTMPVFFEIFPSRT